MGVFRFELKQYKTSIIIWALSLSLAIMFLLPMFSGMLTEDKSSVVSSLQDNPMMEAMGISAENFFSPLGVYAFLSSFLMLAASIHAINLGLSITFVDINLPPLKFVCRKSCEEYSNIPRTLA
jgi:ABC-2 type transport system permease protein